MDLFFGLSKLAWLAAAPSNLILVTILAALLIRMRLAWRMAGARLGLGAAAAYAAIALLPLGDILLGQLEARFPALEDCGPDGTVAGVILLGGGVDPFVRNGRLEADLTESGDRVLAAVRLARLYPSARIVISGGNAFGGDAAGTEAGATRQLLVEQGVAASRIVIEEASRNTAENAARSAPQLRQGQWLLVTSAFHMPRAMGAFRKAGVDVIAAPTDWRSRDAADLFQFSASRNLKVFDLAVREYLGLLGYWISGRSTSPWPGPETACAAA